MIAGLLLGVSTVLTPAMAARPHWEPGPAAVAEYNLAVEALQAHALEPAAQVLRTLIAETDPGCGRCQHTLALTMLRQGNPGAALELLTPLATQHPEQADIWSLLAVTHLSMHDSAQAHAAAQLAVTHSPSALSSWRLLMTTSHALSANGNPASVIQAATAALPPAALDCLRLSDEHASTANEDTQTLLTSCAEAHPELLGELSLARAQSTRNAPAFEQWAQQLHIMPLVHSMAAATALREGDLTAGRAHADRALALNPHDPDALLVRAWCSMLQGDLPLAEQDLIQLHSLEPSFYPGAGGLLLGLYDGSLIQQQAHALYITLLVDTQRTALARQHFDAALSDAAWGSDAHAAALILLLAEGNIEAAVETWQAATQHPPASDLLATAAIRLDLVAPLAEDDLTWLRSHADPGYTVHLASQRHGEGRHEACQEALLPLASSLPVAQRLAHRCALAGGDLAAADALLATLDDAAPPLDGDAVLRHAWMLRAAGRLEDGLHLLQRPPGCAALPQGCHSLQVDLLTQLDRLDEASQLADQHSIDAEPLFNLAVALYAAGQHAQGRARMQQSCTMMTGPDEQQCRAAHAQLR